VLFIGAMKFVFNYHLEVLAVLAVPLIAFETERVGRRRIVIALLIVASLTNATVALFRGKEDDLRYQDAIMTEVDRRTPQGSKVFDSAGWALHREPAYRYWFLREIVRVLVDHGDFERYTPQEMLTQPPAAIIADHDLRLWLVRNPPLAVIATTHYLPSWRDLWLPGMSARLAPGAAQARIVPADGEYRVFASARLATHPWFLRPLNFGRRWGADVPLRDSDASADVAFVVDHRPAPSARTLSLRKGSHIVIANRGAVPLGVMLVRGDPADHFRQPPFGVTLEASASPQWHVPRLR
jgi:hypothetical protein